jgi:bile acid-coenzyme A ligase
MTIALPNGIDFVAACWAVWKLGATPQPLSSRLAAAEFAAIIDLANPAAIIAESAF